MANLPLFFSDLDHTLIFSRRALQRYKNAAVGTVVAEDYLNEPLSYMDLDVWQYLAETGAEFDFIPNTTRTVAQYERILFPSLPEFAIVQNGSRILIRGEEDINWTRKVQSDLAQLSFSPAEIHSQLLNQFPHNRFKNLGIKSITNVEDSFVYMVSVTENMWKVESFAEELSEKAGYTLSKQGRKLYFIPECISKEKAVTEIMERKTPAMSFAAGDSILDFPMSKTVDYFIKPKHGDAWNMDTPPTHVTKFTGLEASKEILETVLMHT